MFHKELSKIFSIFWRFCKVIWSNSNFVSNNSQRICVAQSRISLCKNFDDISSLYLKFFSLVYKRIGLLCIRTTLTIYIYNNSFPRNFSNKLPLDLFFCDVTLSPYVDGLYISKANTITTFQHKNVKIGCFNLTSCPLIHYNFKLSIWLGNLYLYCRTNTLSNFIFKVENLWRFLHKYPNPTYRQATYLIAC